MRCSHLVLVLYNTSGCWDYSVTGRRHDVTIKPSQDQKCLRSFFICSKHTYLPVVHLSITAGTTHLKRRQSHLASSLPTATVCHQRYFEQGTMGKGCRLHLSAFIEPIWALQPLTGWQWDEKPLRFNLDFPESAAKQVWGLLGKQSGVSAVMWWGSSKQLWHLPTWGGKNWRVNDVFTSWVEPRFSWNEVLGPSSGTFQLNYQINRFKNEKLELDQCIYFLVENPDLQWWFWLW